MARRIDKEKAIKMRLKGASYSQIKEKLCISKSTLSSWLSDYPLSEKRIKELRDDNPRRIEKYIATRKVTRDVEFEKFFNLAKLKIGKLNQREFFISGMFLYWAEGGKTERYSVILSNTDPSMLRFFIKWLNLLKVDPKKIRIKLHLYSDMNVLEEINFWGKQLNVSKDQFIKPYIKRSTFKSVTQKSYGHGTCNVIYHNKETAYLVHQGLKYIKNMYSR